MAQTTELKIAEVSLFPAWLLNHITWCELASLGAVLGHGDTKLRQP